MTAGCLSRDPVLDGFFDRIPEQYRPVVRSLALDMAIDIMLSRHPMPRDEWSQLQKIQMITSSWPEVRRRTRNIFGDLEIEVHYVSLEFITEALEKIRRFFSDLGIPSFGQGQIRYFTPTQMRNAKGGRIIKAPPDFGEAEQIWPSGQ